MPAVPALTSRPSLPRRLAARWREARAAALVRSLTHGEVGFDMPAPASLLPPPRSTLETFAHPAVAEIGVPGTLAMIGVGLWQQGWNAYWPAHPVTFVLFLLFHPLWVMMATGAGQLLFRRRYLRMAREAYHALRWRALDEAGAAALDGERTPEGRAAPATAADRR